MMGGDSGNRGEQEKVKLAIGSYSLSVTGRDIILFLTLIVCSGAIVWANYQGFADVSRSQERLANALLKLDADVKADHARLRAADDRLLCLLALPVDERRQGIRSGDVCGYVLSGQFGK